MGKRTVPLVRFISLGSSVLKILSAISQHSPARLILVKNTSPQNSPRHSRVYAVRISLFPSLKLNPHACLRSSINCQQHAHPSCAPYHRDCGDRTTGLTTLSYAQHAMGVKPPTHADHDATPAKRGAYAGGSVGHAVIDATEQHRRSR
jgi:hypothetical protein